MKNLQRWLIILGSPMSGKGTQADLLSAATGWPVFSMGEELRRLEKNHNSSLTKAEIKSLDGGQLLDDALVDKLARRRLKLLAGTVILDGFPRDGRQLNFWLTKIRRAGEPCLVVELSLTISEVLRRVAGRRVCLCGASYHLLFNAPKQKNLCDLCGQKLTVRPDDRPEIVRRRYRDYLAQVKPLLAWAKSEKIAMKLDGRQTIAGLQKSMARFLRESGWLS